MFDNKEKRYITKGVNEQVSKEIHLYCWQLIDKKRSESELDYLQIFEFNPDNQRQAIEVIPRQEEPFFIEYHTYTIKGKIADFQTKPAPDVFLEAARQLKVPSQRCLAFEDTKNGALSASRAEMTVIGFQNPDYPPQDLSVTDKVITSFGDLSVKELISY